METKLYIVERIDHEQENPKSVFRFFTSIAAAWKFITTINDIWPKAEAWLWDTNEFEATEEISIGSLICHLNQKEY